MTLPNFLIIGAGRSGTTSLYHYLNQHPQVYMSPIKEARFFAYDGANEQNAYPVTTIEAYRALFDGVTTQTAVGEASPRYLPSPIAPRRIRQHVPHAKLIAILRNPADRAFASHISRHRDGADARTFDEAVSAEQRGDPCPVKWWPYLDMGFYHRHLTRYYEHFDREQIRLFLFEDFGADAAGVVREILRFLEVDDGFTPDTSVRYNATGLPRNRVMHKLTGKNPINIAMKKHLPAWVRRPAYAFAMRRKNDNLVKPELPVEMRRRLIEHFRDDITALQELIGRDLSSWLTVPAPAEEMAAHD